jgi:hypothetical protein
MKQKLEAIVNRLQEDEYFAITVIGIDKYGLEKRIVTNYYNTDFINKYGSATNFFEQLFKDGIRKVTICLRRKNGTGTKKEGMVEYTFTDNGEANLNEPAPTPPAPKPPAPAPTPAIQAAAAKVTTTETKAEA